MQNTGKIDHEGVIYKTDIDSVYVRILQQTACSECHAKSACGIANAKEKIIEIPGNPEDYKVGEKVIIVGNSSIGLKAVLYAFVIPLMLVIAVLASALYFLDSEGLSALSAIVFLAIYYWILYLFRNNLKNKFIFSIVKSDNQQFAINSLK